MEPFCPSRELTGIDTQSLPDSINTGTGDLRRLMDMAMESQKGLGPFNKFLYRSAPRKCPSLYLVQLRPKRR